MGSLRALSRCEDVDDGARDHGRLLKEKRVPGVSDGEKARSPDYGRYFARILPLGLEGVVVLSGDDQRGCADLAEGLRCPELRVGGFLVLPAAAPLARPSHSPLTDHTREGAPLLAVFAGMDGRRHDGLLADVGASALRWLDGRDAPGLPGAPFA